MCDYVALINKGKKVLDGKINEVRNRYKEGKFKVNLVVNHSDNLQKLINDFKVQDIKRHDGLVSFFVYANQNETNPIIQNLTQIGQIKSFTEEIPTMNQVFINAVKEEA